MAFRRALPCRERLWAPSPAASEVVVGARSALFLPFRIRLIVVDEEHEGAYKQEDGVIYNARDMAVVCARLEAAPSSSLRDSLDRIPRHAEQGVTAGSNWSSATAPAPCRSLGDRLRRAGRARRFLAPKLVTAVEETLAAGEQALLFLNRRGTRR